MKLGIYTDFEKIFGPTSTHVSQAFSTVHALCLNQANEQVRCTYLNASKHDVLQVEYGYMHGLFSDRVNVGMWTTAHRSCKATR
jgi:hypothetical protein